jgi:formylglycine-generating enzyme required for sulfatase activity
MLESTFPFQARSDGSHFFITAGMQFNEVPAGKFLMGSSRTDTRAEENEKPQHIVDLPYDYYMARFPVTNEEYAAFLRSEGSVQWLPGQKRKADHPVANVTWQDATEYCLWLNAVLHGELPFGLVLRLPTEAEWEKAARGRNHFVYPWGNGFAENRNNCDGILKELTSIVGAYSPQGDSPYGCADMSGNVWEWTHSLLKEYPYDAEDGREADHGGGTHVTRGGCYSSGKSARCASRDGSSNGAGFATGFRAAVSIALA